MSRLACLLIPLFPLAARLRSEPELRSEAVAIVEGNGTAAYVIAATRRARKAGIRAELSLPQARAILPRLIARSRDPECERSAQEALLDLAEQFSPRIEDAGEGIVYLDLHGLERQYRHPSAKGFEHDLAREAIRAGEAASLPFRAGIASSKLAARIAAELPKSPVIVCPGDETSFLGSLPLARLAPELEVATRLDQWGIGTIGDLARLPEAEVASRLGETGRALQRAARGVDPRPLIPRVPPPDFREGMDLEWPLVSMEPFLFIANAALARLCQRLDTRGFSCRKLELILRLEPDGFDVRTIDLPAPTRETKTLLTLMRLDLEARPPGASVIGFVFTAHPDRPRTAQLSLFGPLALSPDRLSMTIARLAALVGSDRVGTPAPVDAHAPERFEQHGYDPPAPPEAPRPPQRHRGLLAVRQLRPPIELEVEMREDEPRPTCLRSLPSSPIEIAGTVRVASGPWTLEEGWWGEVPVEREYWDVELVRGGLYRMYFDRRKEQWFADGAYD